MNNPKLLPAFKLGEQYIERSPKEANFKYRFLLKEDIEVHFTHPLVDEKYEIEFKDPAGNRWMKMSGTSLIIFKDYAWDGCTPKKWWGAWWGTPDFKKTALASLVHDVLIQFFKTNHFPFSRVDVDKVFKHILHYNRFILYPIYYAGVRIGTQFPDKDYGAVYSELIIKNN